MTEQPSGAAAGTADASADEPIEDASDEAVEPEPPTEDATDEIVEPGPPTEEDALAARFDAARERLRATIKPPPDDG